MAVNLVQERRWICLTTRQSSAFPPPVTIPDATVECPPFGASPETWTREEVRNWLEGCVSEYGLNLDLPDRFPMNGKGMCMLRKEDFRQRAPDAGDVIYNSFHSFYRGPSTLPYDRRSPDTLTMKRKTMNLEREGLWFDPSIHRSDCESAEVDYKPMVDSSEPLNLKVTRSRPPSPPSSLLPLPVSNTFSTFDLSTTQPLLLFRSPTFDSALNRPLPLQNSTTFDPALHRPLHLLGSSTFDPDPMRPRDLVGVPFSAGGVVQSHLRLHAPSLHPTYLPLLMPLPPYVDLKRNIPTPSPSSPPSSRLSSSSSSSLSPPSLSSSLFPSTLSVPTPASSPTTTPQHTTQLPCYHSTLSMSSSSSSPTPPPNVPPVMHGYCTLSPASVPGSVISQASASKAGFCSSPTFVTTVRKEEPGMDQSQTPKSVSISNEVTPNWSQLMQVSTTSQTPETNPKIHLNLSTSDRLLWKFLAELLNCKTAKCVSWEDRQRLTFQIVDPEELAELWGVEKCKPGMTYEKLSRALRYYYKMNIIAKVPGKRLTYRFITSPQFIKKGKRGAKPGVPHKRRTGVPLSKTVANQNQTKIHRLQQ